MTEKLTSIHLPGKRGTGWADWGVHTVPDMVQQIRAKAQRDLEEAQAILAAADEDFRVVIVKGAEIQRPVATLQEGKKP